jgi:ribose transport system permease protein
MSTKNIRRLISIGLVVILAVVFAVTTESFLSTRNILQLLRESAFVGLLALGMSFVVIGGGIDLSAGGIVCVAGIVCSRLSFIPGMPGFVVLLGGILAGVVCGGINALLVTRVHLTEFVATLASGFVYSGLALLLAFRDSGGTILSKTITNKGFLSIGGKVGGVYHITIVWIILAVILFIVMTKTNFGLHTYAQGSNAKSAQMSGVNSERIKASGFIIMGAIAGLAASMVSSYQSAAPVNLGTGMEFQAIAACVVGGIVLGGGRGDAVGALIGGLFMTLILNGLYKYGLPLAYQSILQGGIIVLATAFDAQFNKMSRRGPKARPAVKEGGRV